MAISDKLRSGIHSAGQSASGQKIQNISKAGIKAAGSTVGINFGLSLGMRKLGGDSWGKALGGTIRDTAFLALAPKAYAAYIVGSMLAPIPGNYIRGGRDAAERYNEMRKNISRPEFTYQDTQQAVTMRQASVQAIQGSKLNARNALGGEASLMHRSYRDRRGS